MQFAGLTLALRIERGEIALAEATAGAWARRNGLDAPVGLAVAGGYAAWCGPGSPLTHAVGAGMRGLVTPSEWQALEAFYRERGHPVSFEICPFAEPSAFETMPRGYRIGECCNALARPLAAGGPPLAADGVTVRQAGPDELGLWAEAMARGFFERDNVSAPEIEIGLLLAEMDGAVCFLAFADGGMAGGGALRIRERMACLCADSTLPAARGRGVQAALIAARLRYAAEAGCDMATASTLPGTGSQRNYERAGFEVVYTRLGFTEA